MRRAALLSSLALVCTGLPASAALHVVHAGQSIQAAVDAARPGDTIVVRPGVYTAPPGSRAVVAVRTDDLQLIGSLAAVLDASGAAYGVLVGPEIDPARDGCPAAPAVKRFRMRGFSVTHASETGLRLAGVEHYRASEGLYLDNGHSGIFALCSRHGRIDHNVASGHEQGALYLGEVDTVRVDHNIVRHSTVGIGVENSSNAVVRHNWVTDNSVGVLVVALPDLPVPFTQNVFVEHNWIAQNNRPSRGSGQVAMLPVGTGLLNLGGDDVVIRKNVVIENHSLGIASLANFLAVFDERLEPFVDGLAVRRNIVNGNGLHPDRERMWMPPGDLIFLPDAIDPDTGERKSEDPDPTDNCFADNHIGTAFPPGVTSIFSCP